MSPRCGTTARTQPLWLGAGRALSGLSLVLLLAGCGQSAEPPAPAATTAATASDWVWKLPSYFPPPRVPADNPMSQAKVALGRDLFYDQRLSGNGTQSCGSCHLQKLAFTDGRAHGLGSTGQLHPRSPMALGNVAYYSTYTWANPALITLERQIPNPIFGESPVEMGVNDNNVQTVLQRLQADARYAPQFAAAFPEKPAGDITWDRVLKAISAFERSLITVNSKYDQFLQGQATLSASETRGLAVFKRAECIQCHQEPNFSNQFLSAATTQPDVSFYNKGLYNVDGKGAYPADSQGLVEITGKPADMGKFRAPTLRNIEVTAPYMHDGSVATLEEVIDLYAAGGRKVSHGPNAGDGRANPFKSELVRPRTLSAQDKSDLVAFLKTLTDPEFLRDPRHADPFATATATAASASAPSLAPASTRAP